MFNGIKIIESLTHKKRQQASHVTSCSSF